MERSSSCSACRVVGAWWTLLKSVRSESNMNVVAGRQKARRKERGHLGGGAAFQMRLGSLQSWRRPRGALSLNTGIARVVERESKVRAPVRLSLTETIADMRWGGSGFLNNTYVLIRKRRTAPTAR